MVMAYYRAMLRQQGSWGTSNRKWRMVRKSNVLSNLVLVAVFLSCVAVLFAQDSPSPDHGSMHLSGSVTALHPAAKVTIPAEANRPVYKPARCDAEGNIYFRAYQSDDRKVPVVRADSAGKTTQYSLDSDADFATATAYDFSILPSGDLYQPVQVGKDVYIVAFDKQGGIRWKTRLEKQFWVSRLVVFDDKSFLVIGTEVQPQSGGPQSGGNDTRTYQPVAALFDRNGRLIRNVTLGTDAAADEKHGRPGTDLKSTPPLLALLGSDGQAGADGKVYLMVRLDPPVVYVIDVAGRTVRSFNVNPPDSRMAAVSMSLDNNKLAILFRHAFQGMSHGEDIISVFDLSRGTEIGRFSAAAELGTVLACFRSNDFVFIGSEQGSLAIQHSNANTPASNSMGDGKHTH